MPFKLSPIMTTHHVMSLLSSEAILTYIEQRAKGQVPWLRLLSPRSMLLFCMLQNICTRHCSSLRFISNSKLVRNDLKQENQLLKNMIADINKRPSMVDEVGIDPDVKPTAHLIEPLNDQVKPTVAMKSKNEKQSKKLIKEFNSKDYMTGVFAYQQDNFQLAIKYFANLHLIGADKNISGNVIYWMADSYQHLGDIDNAMIYLDMVIENNNSDHIDDALIKKGLLYRKRGELDKSLVVLNKLVNNYPKSEYAKLARMEIKRAEIYQ